jgi:hypothetical protein
MHRIRATSRPVPIEKMEQFLKSQSISIRADQLLNGYGDCLISSGEEVV